MESVLCVYMECVRETRIRLVVDLLSISYAVDLLLSQYITRIIISSVPQLVLPSWAHNLREVIVVT